MACLWVLAGTNGSGKSSIGGELLRRAGGAYFNPDELARRLRREHPDWTRGRANAAAWEAGVRLLDEAIAHRRHHFFETTLGGSTITGRLESARDAGLDVRVWYVGLASVELHLARVAARVARGGHPIPEADIRRRFDASRRNLIRLVPRLHELKLFDNSDEADLSSGSLPQPRLLLHVRDAEVVTLADLPTMPDWAKPLVASVLHRARH